MFNKDSYIKLLAVFLGLAFSACKGQDSSQENVKNKDSLIVNCYIVKPIFDDSKADTLRNFDFTNKPLNGFLEKAIFTKERVKYDSTMDFITSFDYQKEIIVNYDCFKELTKPDSTNLIHIYFNSGYATWIKKSSSVQFITSYKKTIRNFGNVTVFEYRFNGVAEIESHFMYIMLKDQTDDEKRYGKDYKGFVICSDGMDWKDYKSEFSIPLFIKMIRRSKELYIPLFYDGKRFIPIGHFKSNLWSE